MSIHAPETTVEELRELEFEGPLSDITKLISVYFEVPIALVSVLMDGKHMYKAPVGIRAEELPPNLMFCRHAVKEPDQVLVVKDAVRDPRYAEHCVMNSRTDIRFFVGAPLVFDDGTIAGSLCLIDRRPRPFSDDQEEVFALFAKQASAQLELQRTHLHLRDALSSLETSDARLERAQRAAHIGSWEFDFRSNVITWSQETFRIFGIDSALGVPKYEDMLRCHTPADRAKLHEHVVKAIKSASSYELELEIERPGGNVRVLAAGETILDDGGLPKMLVGTVRELVETDS